MITQAEYLQMTDELVSDNYIYISYKYIKNINCL